MKFEDIKNNFKFELSEIDNFIKNSLNSKINIIGDIGSYITSYKGKKIRPLITIIFDRIFQNNINETIKIASAIELIHTATLLHDDVVDSSNKRRGKISTNKIWGNKEAILVGDFLYTKSFEIMVTLKNLTLLEHMAKTTNIISKGEIRQLLNKNNIDIKESDYFKIIRCKTAQLFASSATVSAILSKKKKFINETFKYGINLGIVYQLIDDILDYTSKEENFGKTIGNDILNGTFTLPLIYTINQDTKIKDKIKKIILYNDLKKVSEIKNIVLNSNAINYTIKIANEYVIKAKKAISQIENSKNKEMIFSLLDFIMNRHH